MLAEAGLLLLAVVGISFSAPLAAAAAVPSLAIAFWRTAMASAVLAPVVAARPDPRRVGAGDARTCAVAGVLLAVHFATWVPSLVLTSVATSTALVCTAPLWTAVLTRLRGGRVAPAEWAGVAVALAGVLLVAGVDLAGSPRALLGDALALVGGLAMAGYLLAGAAARERLATSTYTLLCYGTAALVLLAVVLVAGVPLAGWPAAGWLSLVAITLCGQFLGHSLLNRALRTVGAPVVAVVSLLEVPGAALVAALWLGERLAPATLVGLVVLLGGVALVVRGSRRA
ncbi:DMT family transporter [Actinomycetospora callitridis]|uniref:DMT family transporter n=1 Tax=Actinomycetospora callitridis TaxID=913944 RepID=UPI0023656562|nr:DMT family transporter [Actinomycetospora callitridis]MDD7919238.1 DMT family transporter [Actinomycetospora callitridis]